MNANDQLLSPFSHLQNSQGFLLWRVFLTWKREVDLALKPHGLVYLELVVLVCLSNFEKSGVAATQTKVARTLGFDVSAVAYALRDLDTLKKLINRETLNVDKARKYPKINELGKEVLQKALKDLEVVEQKFFSRLKNTDVDFIDYLKPLMALKWN